MIDPFRPAPHHGRPCCPSGSIDSLSGRLQALRGKILRFGGRLQWGPDLANPCPRRPALPAQMAAGTPEPGRAQTVHALLEHVWHNGFPYVPLPRQTRNGQTCIVHEGHFWELTPWLPGLADFGQSPSITKLRAAMTALARFIGLLRPLEGLVSNANITGIQQQWVNCGGGAGSSGRRARDSPGVWPELESRARRILRLATNLPGVSS